MGGGGRSNGDFEIPAKRRRYKKGGVGKGEGNNADDAGSMDAEKG